MKERIITGAVGSILILVTYLLLNTVYLNILLALMCIIAVLEVQHVFKLMQNRALTVLNILFAGFIPFSFLFGTKIWTITAIIVYYICFCIIVERDHNIKALSRMISVAAVSFVTVFSMCTLYFIRDIGKSGVMDLVPEDRLLLFTYALGSAWVSDIGAYFVGVFFGKHKLCPEISPKKTVEGAVGGVVSWVLIAVLATYLHTLTVPVEIASVNYFALIIVSIFGSVLSIVGDLFASSIKRANGVKDFGHIFPGHGGVLDRFDSLLVTGPYYFIILQFVHIIVRY